MNINENVYDALKILIKISKNAQEAHPDIKQSMGLTLWLKEFCTVRVSTSRRTGHTTAIRRLIEENDMKLGVIFTSKLHADEFEGNLGFSATMRNYENFIRGRTFEDLDGIVIDMSFMMSQKKKDNMYRTLAPALIQRKEPFFLIFLQ
jgi:hypothetical protein